MMKIVVGGCRFYEEFDDIQNYLDNLLADIADNDVVLISGHCRGVDMLAERYAGLRGYGLCVYKADWQRYGRSAGVRRNRDMVDAADMVVAFWDGKSRGTASLIHFAEKSGKPLFVKRIKA